jgi:hypothetical protein
LHDEELHNLHSSTNIIRMIKSRMRWVAHVACMGAKRNACCALVGQSEGGTPLERATFRSWGKGVHPKNEFTNLHLSLLRLFLLIAL